MKHAQYPRRLNSHLNLPDNQQFKSHAVYYHQTKKSIHTCTIHCTSHRWSHMCTWQPREQLPRTRKNCRTPPIDIYSVHVPHWVLLSMSDVSVRPPYWYRDAEPPSSCMSIEEGALSVKIIITRWILNQFSNGLVYYKCRVWFTILA